MPDTVRIGVIGAGSMARNVHIPSFKEIDGAEVVAICDRIGSRADELAKEFDIPARYTQQEKMLDTEELDAVAVFVEPASLYHVTRRCLEAKLPTLMEKPPGATSFQAESLARIAKENGVFLEVAFNRRYIPLVKTVVSYVQKRTRMSQIEGRFMKQGRADFDTGSLSAFPSDTIHCVDLVRSIAGSEPKFASTIIDRINDDVDNSWNSVCKFENGITATIRANYQTGGRVHTFELLGPGVSAFINLGFAEVGCDARVILGSGSQGYSLAATGSGSTEIVDFDGIEIADSDEFRKYYGYFQEDVDFIESIQQNRLPECTIEDAAGSFRMVDMLLEARLNG
ncbi:MAG: Gfo/Idh/MocA family oxidoreductase [Spirochaetales bacterium]|jgi:virulence factor|nr:Gfo/Idh/MocA family oxidoreductase [Spirochaetales bacterium]